MINKEKIPVSGKIQTEQFGEVTYNPEHIINFPSGLLGFEKVKDFLLIKTDDELFYWLNAIENPELCFPLVGTRIIDESFPSEEGHEAFGIVTLNQDPLKIIVNLKAPVYINQDNKKGFQKVLEDEKYPLNYHLFIE
jgi:flagellar assembly factor FliW